MQKNSFTPHQISAGQVVSKFFTKNPNQRFGAGFSLIELLIVVSILLILVGIAMPTFRLFQRESDLGNGAEEIVNSLKLAQNKTLASEGDSQWGIFFDTSTDMHEYVLFKGTSFASRDASFDKVHKLATTIKISDISLDAGSEVVFNCLTGAAYPSGSISLAIKKEPEKTSTIFINESGQVGLSAPLSPSDDNRIKDSRHVHINYSRTIATISESLVLTFEGGVTETIVIADNMEGGQIIWEGEVEVAGEAQKIKVHTHRLNAPDTQFCIHRDRRYNSKVLSIDINDVPDPDLGTIIEYSADGSTITKTSIYASDATLQ